MAEGLPLAPFYGQVRIIITFLDRAAFDPRAFEGVVGKQMAPALTVAAFVRFVFLLNAYLSVRVTEFDEYRDLAGYRIRHAFSRNEAGEPMPLSPEERNDPAISLVLAWQLVADPMRTLLAGLHTANPVHRKAERDAGRFMALVGLLLEFWPGEMLSLLLTGRSRFPIDGPFHAGFVAANMKAASLIGQARRDAWRPSQDGHAGH